MNIDPIVYAAALSAAAVMVAQDVIQHMRPRAEGTWLQGLRELARRADSVMWPVVAVIVALLLRRILSAA